MDNSEQKAGILIESVLAIRTQGLKAVQAYVLAKCGDADYQKEIHELFLPLKGESLLDTRLSILAIEKAIRTTGYAHTKFRMPKWFRN